MAPDVVHLPFLVWPWKLWAFCFEVDYLIIPLEYVTQGERIEHVLHFAGRPFSSVKGPPSSPTGKPVSLRCVFIFQLL